ncbi:MAG: sugar phosphate isomerase/epimerase [Sphingobacterium sp.]|jgi:sugar phosphate isomerase/epimerase|nr:sugar phosphate isomerase/epimerase [Sphingobacterium sp.]
MVKVDFFYPRWGSEHIAWDTFLDSIQKEGYCGVEWFPFGEDTDHEEVLRLLHGRGLKYTIVTCVVEPFDHVRVYYQLLEKQLSYYGELAKKIFRPEVISVQMGREYFEVEDIVQGLHLCERISQQYGVPVLQETHRNKWNYGLHTIPRILKLFPGLRLTLDISHWYCVSESYLEDRKHVLEEILPHVDHIHARVGHSQGSQVPDVRERAYRQIVDTHVAVWQKWIDLQKDRGVEQITICTEFGPPPYLISSGNQDLDKDKQWQQNIWIKKHLEHTLIL